jgi:hypothetical protein
MGNKYDGTEHFHCENCVGGTVTVKPRSGPQVVPAAQGALTGGLAASIFSFGLLTVPGAIVGAAAAAAGAKVHNIDGVCSSCAAIYPANTVRLLRKKAIPITATTKPRAIPTVRDLLQKQIREAEEAKHRREAARAPSTAATPLLVDGDGIDFASIPEAKISDSGIPYGRSGYSVRTPVDRLNERMREAARNPDGSYSALKLFGIIVGGVFAVFLALIVVAIVVGLIILGTTAPTRHTAYRSVPLTSAVNDRVPYRTRGPLG